MTLKFTNIVADENVPKEVVDHLKVMGFKEVYWILEKKHGISDPEVWNLAASKSAVLITGDVGFVRQLPEKEFVDGPAVIEYATKGFKKSELMDPKVMTLCMDWMFNNCHHEIDEYLKIVIQGNANTRREIFGPEKARRKRLP
ncbi:DUF5615 family PIN-like protein [Candidatus Neomarinimicrobiota bacterium]